MGNAMTEICGERVSGLACLFVALRCEAGREEKREERSGMDAHEGRSGTKGWGWQWNVPSGVVRCNRSYGLARIRRDS